MNTSDIDIKAMFLGARAENNDLFSEHASKLLTDHSQWRKDFHSEDQNIIDYNHKNTDSFVFSKNKMASVLDELSSKLRKNMMPSQSPRYLGHMIAETLMPAELGYFAAMLYNGNNVAYEAAPATCLLEEEVGVDLCNLMGYDPKIAWGHITSDGSTANYESLWYMRNVKSVGLALKKVAPELVEDKSEWELLNLSVDELMSFLDKIPSKLDDIKGESARCKASEIGKLGKLLVPETKHYSWLKGADILGIGLDNVVSIKVDSNYRMDVNALKEAIDDLISKQIPILGVVSVVGTTEEGAVDSVHKVLDLKKYYSESGINFYYHVDAAYGGYGRSIFLDEANKFIPFEQLHNKYNEHNVFVNKDIDWPSKDVYEAYKAMSEADSITVDPHKMGYIPYWAGGLVIRDKRIRNVISYFANYVFQKDTYLPDALGAFIFGGSKAGASAAAIWAAHRVMPLNITGHGKLIGASVEGAYNLYNKLNNQEYKIGDVIIEVKPLIKPDFNMVDYVFNIKGNTNLELMNKLNFDFYKTASYFSVPYLNDFIVSHTEFDYSDYNDSPLSLIESCGMAKSEWDKIHKVVLIRSCVLSAYLNDPKTFDYYSKEMDKSISKKLTHVLSQSNNE